jgi:hypothetical protein
VRQWSLKNGKKKKEKKFKMKEKLLKEIKVLCKIPEKKEKKLIC